MSAQPLRLGTPAAEAPTRGAERTGRRLSALDGLRGVAALVVLLHHTLAVAEPHLRASDEGTRAALWGWLSASPLKLFTAGGEAVVLFFVLSGLVVALPALRGGFSWAGFLASRFVRIMVPVWGSLVVACALVVAIPRDPGAFPGGWLVDNNAATLVGSELVAEATLGKYSYEINNVLWSLRWEMLFALLLPLFVLGARATRRGWLPAGLLALAASVVGFTVGDGTLSYLPAFFIGTLIAVRLDDLQDWGRRVSGTRAFRIGWPIALAASLLGFIATWLVRPMLGAGGIAETLRAASVISSAVLIVLAIVAAPVVRVLSGRLCAWLGKISFSLYLVHVPVLVAIAYLLGDEDWWIAVLLAPPAGIGAGYLFWRFVERPSHSLARRLGRLVGGAVRERRSSPEPPVNAVSSR
ncbi:acyltransferase [Herbiconiux sp. L3-i23]|uniref:acyltransferase family protein n=1 Tax=Herbiconiux sp. L3-i23 TaxID=2905871 RepID=UPI002072DCE7|nr:acyltransferase [Herbiconiux sp. L3-i23]